MQKKMILAIVALILGNIAQTIYAESASVLLEKGIYAEETAGNVDEAMSIYQKIIADEQANRQAAAQAYYRLGKCYQKKGDNNKAIELFQKLIANYPEQKELIGKAQQYVPTKEMPVTEFPEIVGCRLKQTAELTLNLVRPMELTTKKIYQGDLLSLSVIGDPKLIQSFKYYGLIILPFDKNLENFEYQDIYNQKPFTKEMVLDKQLTPGTYRLVIFGTNEKVSPEIDRNKRLEGLAELKLEVLFPPRTQISIDDIQADGKIKWTCIGQQVNQSGKTITSDDSRTSDFIKADKFFDQEGKPLKAEITHEGSYYRYHVILNQPVLPNQLGIGWMEGTITGFIHGVPGTNDSWEYKFNHHPGGSDPVRRIEIYRLPKGAEVVSTEPANMLRREIKGQIELAHVQMIPSGGSILTQFIYKLPKAVTKEDKLEAERLSAQGWQLWQQRKLAEAEELFKKAADKDPKNTKALNGLGWSQFKQGMPENGIVAFEKCLAIDPKHAAALNGLGWIYDGKGEKNKAIEYWERAVDASPYATAAISGLTIKLMELKQYDKAVKYYKKWLAVEPNNTEAKQGLEKAQALAKANSVDSKK
jgi:tetratricopeptide (TPR) repeat protein